MKKEIFKKQIFTAVLASMGYILSTFVSFPRMAPFQHFINVIAAVFLGPFWGFSCALMTGLMRMTLNGCTILAVIGAVVGAFLSGLLYKISNKLIFAVVGEVIGTGVLSAIIAYPFMRIFYGLPDMSIFTYVPFFIPSSFMGAVLGYALLKTLDRSNVLLSLKSLLDN
ncbi:energy coupling factor transporter S component ThiW [Clostridium aestuarii]|uniref:Energy coupling factor transporter S component ThiW n=1 Tax=Clostridium aestuarii TaxID=338193 RepID=A0ABT4CYP2_9CLOT|nr:energy coupling factor transporter S component ThiW [Clostridium aestuarii]MCY6484093.1 energy coupling factor transporter S component ThiW [Clostridium aestuarii]